jgi:hypothetical protein
VTDVPPTPDSNERSPEGSAPAPRRSVAGRLVSGSQLLKAYIFVVSSLTVLGVFVFTYQMVQSLSRQVATTSRVLARFCAQASFPAAEDPELHRILRELTSGIDFPMVITDSEGTPRAWRSVGIADSLIPASSIDSLKAGFAIAPAIMSASIMCRSVPPSSIATTRRSRWCSPEPDRSSARSTTASHGCSSGCAGCPTSPAADWCC